MLPERNKIEKIQKTPESLGLPFAFEVSVLTGFGAQQGSGVIPISFANVFKKMSIELITLYTNVINTVSGLYIDDHQYSYYATLQANAPARINGGLVAQSSGGSVNTNKALLVPGQNIINLKVDWNIVPGNEMLELYVYCALAPAFANHQFFTRAFFKGVYFQ